MRRLGKRALVLKGEPHRDCGYLFTVTTVFSDQFLPQTTIRYRPKREPFMSDHQLTTKLRLYLAGCSSPRDSRRLNYRWIIYRLPRQLYIQFRSAQYKYRTSPSSRRRAKALAGSFWGEVRGTSLQLQALLYFTLKGCIQALGSLCARNQKPMPIPIWTCLEFIFQRR